jgi:hypothetical protein
MHDLNLGESEKQVLYPLYKKLRETLVNLKREAVGSVLSIAQNQKNPRSEMCTINKKESEKEKERRRRRRVQIFKICEHFCYERRFCIRKSVLILHQVNTECIVICII